MTPIFRPASFTDDGLQIAQLIYQTDPYIYPFWFPQKKDAMLVLQELLYRSGSIFHYSNIFLAVEQRTVLGLIVALSRRTKLDFPYETLQLTDQQSVFTIEHYVKKAISEAKSSPSDTLIITNLCTTPSHRKEGIGAALLSSFMLRAQKMGYRCIQLDCLSENSDALKLYSRLGFQKAADGIGFDGSRQSKVQIVTLSRQL